MKTKSLFIVATLLLLASCGGGYNPPDRPTTNPNTGENPNSGATNKQPHAEFSYQLQHPLKVVFKDISFKTDKDKINLEERIKKLSPETEINIL